MPCKAGSAAGRGDWDEVRMSDLTKKRVTTTEAPWVRNALIALALAFILLFLVLPLAAVFAEALRQGAGAYLAALREPDAWSAISLTLVTAAIAVPLNLIFGI